MTVRLGGALSDPVNANVGESENQENASEFRRNKEPTEKEAIDRLKADLTRAFAAPEDTYQPLSAADLIARNQI
jgi:antitoxin ParD1/3/4